jgi:aminopeptidase N
VPKYGTRGPNRCASVPLTVEGSGPGPGETPDPPNPTAGARTLNDPLLPQIGNGGYDARHYDINLDFDPTANSFNSASTTMRAVATQDLSELSLDFQDLPVDGVLVNGAAAGFTQVDATPALAGGGTQPMKLVVVPPAPIANGSEFTVEVSYHGEPQVFTDPDGSDEGWIPNAAGSYFVVGEPMGSQAWFPSNNHPSDKATFSTTVTVPTGYTALGVGERTSGSTTTWSWNEDDPTATYLVTASVASTPLPGQYSETSITEDLTGRTLPIYDTVAPSAVGSLVAINMLTARNKEMIDALGVHYGAYPLDSYGSFWDINPSIGYALEVQTKSHFSSVVGEGTYVHELAHQWWGNAVTLHDWNDLWFNEGWAQFSDWLFQGPNVPKDNFDDQYANASAGSWSTAPAVLDNDPAKMFSPSFPTYTRGAMTLVGYREIIGTTAFDQFARELQAEFAHGNIDTPQFIDFALDFSGFSGDRLELLDDYFQQWLYGTTKPTLTYADFP